MRDLEHELRAHAQALRQLARSLVGAQDADDLVQDTALQALTRPPAVTTGLRGWLRAVMRHRASKHRRGERRRLQREAAVASPEAASTPLRAAAHKETIARLHGALMALPEPYLATLLLRFFEELTPTEIAEQTGAALATVKSRLRRGLALLRERLEGDGSDWRAALGAAFGLGRALPLAAALGTGVLMGTGVKSACAATAAAALLAAWLWIGDGQPFAPKAPGEKGQPPAVAAAALDVQKPAEPGAAPAPDPLARVAAPEGHVGIRGRCIDEHGAPIARLRVELRGSRVGDGAGKDFAREYGEWLLQRGGFASCDVAITTGDDGRFEFRAAISPLQLSLRVQQGDLDLYLGLGQLLRPEERDLGDILVPTECSLRLRVVDMDVAPVRPSVPYLTRARDAAMPRPGAMPRHFEAWPVPLSLGADGCWSFRLVADNYNCEIRGRKIRRGATWTIPPGVSHCERDVVVETIVDAEVMTGVAVDAWQRPLANVEVCASNSLAAISTCTDADGHFILSRPPSDGAPVRLQLQKAGFLSHLETDCAFVSRTSPFVLQLAPTLELRVIDPDGNPVEDFAARWWQAPGNLSGGFTKTQCSGHFAGGVAHLDNMPAGNLLVLVEPHRWDLWRSLMLPLTVPMQGTGSITVRVPIAADRRLSVRAPDDAPLPKALVEVVEQGTTPLTLGTQVATMQQWSQYEADAKMLLVQRGQTDANGELQLHGPAAGELALRITTEAGARIVEHVSLRDREPLVITIGSGARLVAHIGPPEFVAMLRQACGLPATGAAPIASKRNQPGFRLCRGNMPSVAMLPPSNKGGVLIDGDGTVVFEHAPTGDWQLTLDAWSELPKEIQNVLAIADVTLREDATTEIDVDLGDWMPGELAGTVRCNGAVLANGVVLIECARREARYPAHGWQTEVKTDAEGRFRYRARHGTVRVGVDRRDPKAVLFEPQVVWSNSTAFVPLGGKVTEEFDIVACPLQLRVVDAAGAAVPGVRLFLQGQDPRMHHTTPPSDRLGRIDCDVEAGAFEVLVLPERLQEQSAQTAIWIAAPGNPDPLAPHRLPMGSLVATPDRAMQLDLHLPPGWQR